MVLELYFEIKEGKEKKCKFYLDCLWKISFSLNL